MTRWHWACCAALAAAAAACAKTDYPTACSLDGLCDGLDSSADVSIDSAVDATSDAKDAVDVFDAYDTIVPVDTHGETSDVADVSEAGSTCGNGKREGSEECDLTDLGSATCSSLLGVPWSGSLFCTTRCKFDTSSCTPPATTWNALTDGSKWSSFDVTSVNGVAKGFAGAAFDGRNIYLVPNNNGAFDGVVARYDTTSSFGTATSWSTFDVSLVNGGARGFFGAAFQADKLFLVPKDNGGVVARFDTKGSFTSSSMWSTFDATTIDGAAGGFVGAVSDGKYLYFVPSGNGYNGTVARYDTSAALDSASSWKLFDVSKIFPTATGFFGGAFDGQYLYFVPNRAGFDDSGLVVRYATGLAFDDATAWSSFDVTTKDSKAKAFHGAGFDGRFLYLIPYQNGVVARYDTTASFTAAAGWNTFDLTTVAATARSFSGATFDGKYVYLAPNIDNRLAVRCDTTALFTSSAAWETHDIGTGGFVGAVFDGQNVYLVPNVTSAGAPTGVVWRFQAKSTAWLPKGWSSSFY